MGGQTDEWSERGKQRDRETKREHKRQDQLGH